MTKNKIECFEERETFLERKESRETGAEREKQRGQKEGKRLGKTVTGRKRTGDLRGDTKTEGRDLCGVKDAGEVTTNT